MSSTSNQDSRPSANVRLDGSSTTATAAPTPVLEARGLVKRFGRVTALTGSDLQLFPGEVLAVIGDNGAGKSSLIKCLSGAMVPDEGEMLLEGEPLNFRGPQDAQAAGIETVYQTLAVAPALDIATNMFLGRESCVPGRSAASSGWSIGPGCAVTPRRPSMSSGSAPFRTSPKPWRRCPAASARRWRSPGRRPSGVVWSSSTSRPRRSA